MTAGAIALTALAVEMPMYKVHLWHIHADAKYVVFCFAMALWGTSTGISQSAVEAILGDSVPTGQSCRSFYQWQTTLACRPTRLLDRFLT